MFSEQLTLASLLKLTTQMNLLNDLKLIIRITNMKLTSLKKLTVVREKCVNQDSSTVRWCTDKKREKIEFITVGEKLFLTDELYQQIVM